MPDKPPDLVRRYQRRHDGIGEDRREFGGDRGDDEGEDHEPDCRGRRRPAPQTTTSAMPPAMTSEKNAIHSLRPPRPSAIAPSSGLPMATSMPAAAAP